MADTIIQGNQNTTKLINQLKRSASQYPVLDKADEKRLISDNKNDRDKLNKLLFMHNIRTVFNLAKGYMSKTRDYDGLVQNGMMGLMEAAKRFDIGRDIKFCTYATAWVRKYMTMPYYSSQFKIDMNSVSLNAPLSRDAAESQQGFSPDESIENVIMKDIDLSCASDNKNVIDEISANEHSNICGYLYSEMEKDNSLSATDKSVFKDIFVDREKTRDIADKYGIEPTAVNEIKHRILDKFRNILETRYGITSYAEV